MGFSRCPGDCKGEISKEKMIQVVVYQSSKGIQIDFPPGCLSQSKKALAGQIKDDSLCLGFMSNVDWQEPSVFDVRKLDKITLASAKLKKINHTKKK